ncbi:retrovirus-related pol polyprotein from transposon TNT 1-94 [Tanacetum coccineum]
MKVEESLNVTFDESPPPTKLSPLVDDDVGEEEAIRKNTKLVNNNNEEDDSIEVDEIVNINESKNHPLDQIVAMQKELNQFLANDVWELVPLPISQSVIGTKWVFRNKLDKNGIVSRNKARLMAQGYNQQEGIDYDETYAPVARLESIRILLAIACANDFKLYQMDVKSAFLNGFINEEVYVAQPPGFIDFQKPNYVCKLKKALYGLKQAPKAWYDTLKTFLIKHKYSMGMVDNTLFTKKLMSHLIIVQLYVKDIIFGSTSKNLCDDFAKIMHDKFEMSMMGELNFFLGLQIKQMEDGILFNQSKYIKEMLKKFGLEDSKPTMTPMSMEIKLTKDDEADSVDSSKYRGMIGSLLYLTASRPDIMFSVCLCAHFQENPKTTHLESVKRIFSEWSLNSLDDTPNSEFFGPKHDLVKKAITIPKTTRAQLLRDPNTLYVDDIHPDLKGWELFFKENFFCSIDKRNKEVIKKRKGPMPFGMLLTRLFNHILETNPQAINRPAMYTFHECVMDPLDIPRNPSKEKGKNVISSPVISSSSSSSDENEGPSFLEFYDKLSDKQPNERTSSPPPRKKYLSPPQAPSKPISSKSTHYTSLLSPSESSTPTHVAPPPKLRFVISIKLEPQELPPSQMSPNGPYAQTMDNWPPGPSNPSPPPRVS